MRRFGLILVALIFAGGGLFWLLTAPKYVDPADLSGLVGDAAHGEKMFALGGCASCHAAPDATGAAKLVLSGGKSFVTEFGTFYAPNISPDPLHGIGGWSEVFFGQRAPGWGTIASAALGAGAAGYVASANQTDEVAGRLGIPLVAWVAFATLLSEEIWRKNEPEQVEAPSSPRA